MKILVAMFLLSGSAAMSAELGVINAKGLSSAKPTVLNQDTVFQVGNVTLKAPKGMYYQSKTAGGAFASGVDLAFRTGPQPEKLGCSFGLYEKINAIPVAIKDRVARLKSDPKYIEVNLKTWNGLEWLFRKENPKNGSSAPFVLGAGWNATTVVNGKEYIAATNCSDAELQTYEKQMMKLFESLSPVR